MIMKKNAIFLERLFLISDVFLLITTVALYLFSFVGHFVLVYLCLISMEDLQGILNVSEKD